MQAAGYDGKHTILFLFCSKNVLHKKFNDRPICAVFISHKMYIFWLFFFQKARKTSFTMNSQQLQRRLAKVTKRWLWGTPWRGSYQLISISFTKLSVSNTPVWYTVGLSAILWNRILLFGLFGQLRKVRRKQRTASVRTKKMLVRKSCCFL